MNTSRFNFHGILGIPLCDTAKNSGSCGQLIPTPQLCPNASPFRRLRPALSKKRTTGWWPVALHRRSAAEIYEQFDKPQKKQRRQYPDRQIPQKVRECRNGFPTQLEFEGARQHFITPFD